MRLLFTAIAAAALLSAPALAQQGAGAVAAPPAPAGEYVMDPPHASFTWKAYHQRLSWYTARFTSFNIALDFNPTDVAKSKVSFTLDPKSIETDYVKTRPAGNTTDFNSEIASRFLQTDKFPKITFVSTSIKKTGEKKGTMTGNLTFLGVTKPVTMEVAYTGDANDPRAQKHKVAFEASGSFKMSDFGLSPGFLGDELKFTCDAELAQK